MQERRRHDRSRSFQPGTIADRRRGAATDCVVRDISTGGALLLLDEPFRAPCEMDLAFVRGGGIRRARVVWRGAIGVGVVFAVDAPEAVPAAPRTGATVVSLAMARRSRAAPTDGDRLADRIAAVTAPRQRSRPDWV